MSLSQFSVQARPDYLSKGWFAFKSEKTISVGNHIKTGSDGYILLDNLDSLFHLEPNSELKLNPLVNIQSENWNSKAAALM
jgi:hypothetical protein